MSTHTPARVHAGVPTAGQFAATPRGEPDLSLRPARPAPATLPSTDDLVPVELEAGAGMAAGWGLADRRTGTVVFGNDRRRGRHASLEQAQEWARTTYPLIRKVAARTARVTLNPPGRLCPTCGAELVQDIADQTRAQVLTACDSCGDAAPTMTARPARRNR